MPRLALPPGGSVSEGLRLGYLGRVSELVGPIPERVTRDLEQLKLRLFEMQADELPEAQAEALAREVSAIRLHLKRLAADREAYRRRHPG